MDVTSSKSYPSYVAGRLVSRVGDLGCDLCFNRICILHSVTVVSWAVRGGRLVSVIQSLGHSSLGLLADSIISG